MSYPFDSITINKREVPIKSIHSGAEIPQTAFEISTFTFIREWLDEKIIFTQHTSGSTGIPKSINIRREQMIASAKATAEALNLVAGEIAFVCMDTAYIAGKMMLVRAFVTGLKIIATEPTSEPLKDYEASTIDFAAFVPLQVYRMLESSDAASLNKVRTAIIGGAPLSETAIEKLQSYSCRFLMTYGMTETISHVALRVVNGEDRTFFFQTLPGISVHLDDRGCLAVDVPYLEQTIVTNDMALLHSDTQFTWLGRIDNIINTGGVKVNPEKVEAQIETIFERLNINRRFFIVGKTHPELGQEVTLVVEGGHDQNIVEFFLKPSNLTLPTYEKPRKVLFLPRFESTETGKIKRKVT